MYSLPFKTFVKKTLGLHKPFALMLISQRAPKASPRTVCLSLLFAMTYFKSGKTSHNLT